jgi:histidinol-phosphatase (PHP family)
MFGNSYSLADYHVHPNFSFDAEGSIDEFCQAALNRGLNEICFTTHYDTNPVLSEEERSIRINGKMIPNSVDNIRPYVEAVQEAHKKYYPSGLMVQGGIEVGYYPGCEKEIAALFKTYPFHYKLGAIHEVGEFNICYRDQVERYGGEIELTELATRYFALVGQAAASGLFDAIAHLDLYKKYGLKYYGEEVLGIHKEYLEPVLKSMAGANVGLELNTSALRKGHSEYYPSMDIVNMARRAGVRIVAIGSDAHRPEDVGYDFEAAAAIAYELFPYCDE